MFDLNRLHLTKAERRTIQAQGVTIEVVDNQRYKRKEIVWHTPDGDVIDWVVWKMARVKGGKVKRLSLENKRKGAFWKLMHRNRWGRKGWHSQLVKRSRIVDLVTYAVKHDWLDDCG